MNKYLKFYLLLFPLLLNGCFSNNTMVSSKSSTSSSQISLSYNDVIDKFIFWSNIFSIDLDSYYVYFFSKTCGHCNSIKQFIIDIIIKRNDIFLVESSEQDILIKDVEITIGLTSIDGFGIYGYPSLIKIEQKKITKNLAGISQIRGEFQLSKS